MLKKILIILTMLCTTALLSGAETAVVSTKDFAEFGSTNKGQFFTIKGIKYGPFQETGDFYSNLDMNNWGIITKKNNKYYALVNGKEFGPYDFEYAWGFKFYERGNTSAIDESSTDGTSWALFGRTNETETAVINGKIMGSYKRIESILLSSKKDKWLIKARVTDEASKIITPEKTSDLYKVVYDDYLLADGNQWGYRYRNDNNEEFEVLNGKEYGPCQWVGDRFFISDSKKWALEVGKDNGLYYITDATTFGPFTWAHSAMPDNKSNWMVVGEIRDTNDQMIIKNGEIVDTYPKIGGEVFLYPEGIDIYAFEVKRQIGNSEIPSVIINGVEYEGRGLNYVQKGNKSWFRWYKTDKNKLVQYTYPVKE